MTTIELAKGAVFLICLVVFFLIIRRDTKKTNHILSKDDVLKNWKKNGYKDYPKKFHDIC